MGHKSNVIIGEKFGRLKVLKNIGLKNGRVYVTCLCDCGNIKDMPYGRIRNGRIYSCGCYNKEVTRKMMQTHKLSNSKLYKIFSSMKQRCYNPNNKKYRLYGYRGIKIYNEWLSDFEEFYKWAINNGYKEGLSIDRIDCNGNYEPGNCRWATPKQQSNNLRKNIIISYKGVHGTISEVAELLNIPYHRLYMRLYRGRLNGKSNSM